ncbi:MAG: LysR family transcriptional regulator [Geminicoccaceae bacterium]
MAAWVTTGPLSQARSDAGPTLSASIFGTSLSISASATRSVTGTATEDARYFLAVARDGQMLGAARRLGASQALLSRRLAALETAIGKRLMNR